MADTPSGEINIILGLLKENREDTKKILEQSAVTNVILSQHVERFKDGDREIDDLKTRVTKVEARCKFQHNDPITDYPPQVIVPTPRKKEPAEATTRKVVKFDPSLWIKIGLLVGAAVAGYATAAKALP